MRRASMTAKDMGRCVADIGATAGLCCAGAAPSEGDAHARNAQGSLLDMGAPQLGASMPAISFWGKAAVKPVRIVLRVVLLAGVHQLGGCAASAGLQSDGRYVLESQEEQASCDTLYKDIWGRIQLVKGLPAKALAEQAAPPPTASLLFGRFFGGADKGLKSVEEYDREGAHIYAVLRVMLGEECANVDGDQELGR